jgi:hypothetical protein
MLQAISGDSQGRIFTCGNCMRALFLGKELMDMVDGTTPKPLSLDAIGHVAWVKKESQAVRHKEQQSHESIHHI